MSNRGHDGRSLGERLPDTRSAAPLSERIAQEVRAELARQGRSRRWLAAAIGCPHVTVARWVRGDHPIPVDELEAMCRALGTSLVRLLVEVNRSGGFEGRPLERVA